MVELMFPMIPPELTPSYRFIFELPLAVFEPMFKLSSTHKDFSIPIPPFKITEPVDFEVVSVVLLKVVTPVIVVVELESNASVPALICVYILEVDPSVTEDVKMSEPIFKDPPSYLLRLPDESR
jgi:hypothetical protein